MPILVDTNVLLRIIVKADARHREVSTAVRLLRRAGHKLWMSAQGAAEFWRVCTRPAAARGGYGLSVADADTGLTRLERVFPLTNESADSYFHWQRLITAHGVQGVQVHDARIAALMLANGITHILTYNRRDFTRFPCIAALSPADVVAGTVPPP